MTINSETRVAGPFEGNDSTTVFPFTFKVFDSDELYVVQAIDAVETVLGLDTDYTVTLNPDQNAAPGGSITLAAPLATDSLLTLTSDLEALQPLDLTNQGGFYPRVINNAFDRVTILIQQLKSVVSRTLKFPLSDGPVTDLPGRTDRAGRVLAFDPITAEPVAGPTIYEVETVAASNEAIAIVASNIDDVNTVADNITDVTNFADVYYGPNATDPTTRRDGSALEEGDLYFNTESNRMHVYAGGAWHETPGGSVSVQNFSGDGVETEFLLDYAPETELVTQVFIAGIYQQKNTYELGGVDGDVLIFSEAPPVGTDNIEVVVTSVVSSNDILRGELADDDDPAKGDAMIVVKQPGTGTVARTQHDKNEDIYTPGDFGAVGDGTTDDQAAFVAGITWCAANGKTLVALGTYGISKLTVTGVAGFRGHFACTFNALSSTAQTALIEFVSPSNWYVTGTIQLNVNYNLNYDCGFWVYGPTAAQFLKFESIAVGACKKAFKFGNISYPDAIISEITIDGGHTYGCPIACEAIGTQTLISAHGVNWQSDYGTGDASWQALPAIGVRAIGSYVDIHGGEVLMTAITSGALFEIQPITSVTYNNRYGSIHCAGVTVETASPLARAINPNLITPASATGDLNFEGCTGFHSQDLAAFIFTNTDYTGRIRTEGNNFFASVIRTQNNITASGNAVIDCDKTSFGVGFKSWLLGISGGILVDDNGGTLYKNAVQAITIAIFNKVTFNASASTTIRGMDLANSRFVAPYAGVYELKFSAYGSSSTGASRITAAIYKGGVILIAGSTGYSGAANTPGNSDAFATVTLAANDVIECYARPDAANFDLNNSTGNCVFSVSQVG